MRCHLRNERSARYFELGDVRYLRLMIALSAKSERELTGLN